MAAGGDLEIEALGAVAIDVLFGEGRAEYFGYLEDGSGEEAFAVAAEDVEGETEQAFPGLEIDACAGVVGGGPGHVRVGDACALDGVHEAVAKDGAGRELVVVAVRGIVITAEELV